MAEELESIAKNIHGGRPRHDPVMMFKMLFLSFLFDKSDRETEELCTQYLPAKMFLRLPVDAPAPDHSSLSRFRAAILDDAPGSLEEAFRERSYASWNCREWTCP